METSTQYDHSRQPPMRSLVSSKPNQSRSLSPSRNRPLPAYHQHQRTSSRSFQHSPPQSVGRGNIQRPAANNSSVREEFQICTPPRCVRPYPPHTPWNWFRQVVVTFTTTTTTITMGQIHVYRDIGNRRRRRRRT